MLYIIGLGLNDERDLGERARRIAQKAECYCELYTSRWFGSIPNLQALIKNKIQLVDRSFLEEGQERFIENARKRKIVLFVPGDPLAATTHINLMMEAKKRKIPIKIIHNASIFSAIGETGLQLYKFGKTATIPFSGHTDSVKNTLKQNKKSGLHTLLLLDLQSENSTYMHPEIGLQLLIHKKIISRKDKVIFASRLGKTSDIKFGTASQLIQTKMDTPAVIIIPGKLHFAEKEFLEVIEIKKKSQIDIKKEIRKRIPRVGVRGKIKKYTRKIKKPVRSITKKIRKATKKKQKRRKK